MILIIPVICKELEERYRRLSSPRKQSRRRIADVGNGVNVSPTRPANVTRKTIDAVIPNNLLKTGLIRLVSNQGVE